MANFSRIKTWSTGETLTASDLNAEFNNILTNVDPTGIDDESADDAAAQATKDPYAADTLVKATSLEHEIQEIRYILKQLGQQPYWYVDPLMFKLERPKFTYVESLDYTSGGTHELIVGDTVEGETGGGTGYVAHITLTSGTWAAGTAAGTLYLHTRNATAFQSETLKDNGNLNCATIGGASSKNAILISPFAIHHSGSSEQILYSNANIPYEFVALGTSDWSYLYFDDSAIVTAATNVITATQLIDVTTEPGAYSVTKHGRYNGDDKCFFAVLTDGSDNILEFFHDGGDYVSFQTEITERSAADLDTTWVDVDCATSMPSFSTKAMIIGMIEAKTADGTPQLSWRTNGSRGGGLRIIGLERIGTDQVILGSPTPVITDSSQIFEIVMSRAGDDTALISVHGWYFPNGM